MSEPDLGALLARARELQERMAALRRELAARRVEGTAGGGLVKAIATGALRIERVEIDPELLRGGDRELIEDLVAAASNAALANAERMIQEELQRAAGLPFPLPGLPGLG